MNAVDVSGHQAAGKHALAHGTRADLGHDRHLPLAHAEGARRAKQPGPPARAAAAGALAGEGRRRRGVAEPDRVVDPQDFRGLVPRRAPDG